MSNGKSLSPFEFTRDLSLSSEDLTRDSSLSLGYSASRESSISCENGTLSRKRSFLSHDNSLLSQEKSIFLSENLSVSLENSVNFDEFRSSNRNELKMDGLFENCILKELHIKSEEVDGKSFGYNDDNNKDCTESSKRENFEHGMNMSSTLPVSDLERACDGNSDLDDILTGSFDSFELQSKLNLLKRLEEEKTMLQQKILEMKDAESNSNKISVENNQAGVHSAGAGLTQRSSNRDSFVQDVEKTNISDSIDDENFFNSGGSLYLDEIDGIFKSRTESIVTMATRNFNLKADEKMEKVTTYDSYETQNGSNSENISKTLTSNFQMEMTLENNGNYRNNNTICALGNSKLGRHDFDKGTTGLQSQQMPVESVKHRTKSVFEKNVNNEKGSKTYEEQMLVKEENAEKQKHNPVIDFGDMFADSNQLLLHVNEKFEDIKRCMSVEVNSGFHGNCAKLPRRALSHPNFTSADQASGEPVENINEQENNKTCSTKLNKKEKHIGIKSNGTNCYNQRKSQKTDVYSFTIEEDAITAEEFCFDDFDMSVLDKRKRSINEKATFPKSKKKQRVETAKYPTDLTQKRTEVFKPCIMQTSSSCRVDDHSAVSNNVLLKTSNLEKKDETFSKLCIDAEQDEQKFFTLPVQGVIGNLSVLDSCSRDQSINNGSLDLRNENKPWTGISSVFDETDMKGSVSSTEMFINNLRQPEIKSVPLGMFSLEPLNEGKEVKFSFGKSPKKKASIADVMADAVKNDCVQKKNKDCIDTKSLKAHTELSESGACATTQQGELKSIEMDPKCTKEPKNENDLKCKIDSKTIKGGKNENDSKCKIVSKEKKKLKNDDVKERNTSESVLKCTKDILESVRWSPSEQNETLKEIAQNELVKEKNRGKTMKQRKTEVQTLTSDRPLFGCNRITGEKEIHSYNREKTLTRFPTFENSFEVLKKDSNGKTVCELNNHKLNCPTDINTQRSVVKPYDGAIDDVTADSGGSIAKNRVIHVDTVKDSSDISGNDIDIALKACDHSGENMDEMTKACDGSEDATDKGLEIYSESREYYDRQMKRKSALQTNMTGTESQQDFVIDFENNMIDFKSSGDHFGDKKGTFITDRQIGKGFDKVHGINNSHMTENKLNGKNLDRFDDITTRASQSDGVHETSLKKYRSDLSLNEFGKDTRDVVYKTRDEIESILAENETRDEIESITAENESLRIADFTVELEPTFHPVWFCWDDSEIQKKGSKFDDSEPVAMEKNLEQNLQDPSKFEKSTSKEMFINDNKSKNIKTAFKNDCNDRDIDWKCLTIKSENMVSMETKTSPLDKRPEGHNQNMSFGIDNNVLKEHQNENQDWNYTLKSFILQNLGDVENSQKGGSGNDFEFTTDKPEDGHNVEALLEQKLAEQYLKMKIEKIKRRESLT